MKYDLGEWKQLAFDVVAKRWYFTLDRDTYLGIYRSQESAEKQWGYFAGKTFLWYQALGFPRRRD